MNKNALKELVAYVFFVISLTGVIVLLYGSAKDEALALLKGEDYILYAPSSSLYYSFFLLFLFFISIVLFVFYSFHFVINLKQLPRG